MQAECWHLSFGQDEGGCCHRESCGHSGADSAQFDFASAKVDAGVAGMYEQFRLAHLSKG
jgi:hypothetical protein